MIRYGQSLAIDISSSETDQRVFAYWSPSNLLQVFLMQPHIDYCCTVWGQSCHIIRIHKLQKLALRIIYDKPKLASSGPLFKAAGVLPIQQRAMLRTAIMVYKSLNNWVPKYISDMFVLN
jgi:hypothetical protein